MRLGLARTRLIVSTATGVIGFVVAIGVAPWQFATLIGWDVTAVTMAAWVLFALLPLSPDATAALATREDNSRFATDLLLVSASVVSLVGVGFALVKAGQEQGLAKAAATALVVFSVVMSWTVVHIVFLLRYAHLFYTTSGGIEFSGDTEPDYRDFAYVAFTIGMTYQVSDTDLTKKPLRRTATRHALLSYLFGTVIVAMTINVVAGLLR